MEETGVGGSTMWYIARIRDLVGDTPLHYRWLVGLGKLRLGHAVANLGLGEDVHWVSGVVAQLVAEVLHESSY